MAKCYIEVNQHMFSVMEERRRKAESIGNSQSLVAFTLFSTKDQVQRFYIFVFSPVAFVCNAGRTVTSRLCSFLLSLNLLISKYSPYSQSARISHLALLPPWHIICTLADALMLLML